MKLDIVIQSHNFDKRLCWMLSSLLQQKGRIPTLRVIIAIKSANKPIYALLRAFSDEGLNILPIDYGKEGEIADEERFQYRGLTRNDAIKKSDADYILFADTDMVYAPKFFRDLRRLLKREPWSSSNEMMYSRRASTRKEPDFQPTTDMINLWEGQYPCVIPTAWAFASLLESDLKSNMGAGYFHLIKREATGGYYVDEDDCADYNWGDKFPKCKSDQQFRRRVGKLKIPLPIQIHLQHSRASEDKSCLEDKR